MSELELKEKRMLLSEELEGLISNGETEARELNENETSRIAEIRSEIDGINKELEAIEKENRTLINKENNKTNKMEKVNLVSLINSVVEGRSLNENEAAYVDGRTISTRAAIQATVAEHGNENIAEDKMGLEVAIRNSSVLNRIGARWFGNAVGDISIPKYAGSNVLWKGEVAAAEDGAGEFSEINLSPKRLTAYVDVSKQFLLQSEGDVEAILIADLAKAVAEKLDKTVFGAASGDTNTPAGIFYDAESASASTIDYDSILALEAAVEEHNGTDFMFVTNPKVKYVLKGQQMASGLQMVFDRNEIDGYKTVVSNSVAGVACLVPDELVVAQWGGIQITVDPYTQAVNGKIRLIVNAYFDAKLRGDRIAVLGVEE